MPKPRSIGNKTLASLFVALEQAEVRFVQPLITRDLRAGRPLPARERHAFERMLTILQIQPTCLAPGSRVTEYAQDLVKYVVLVRLLAKNL